MSNTTSRVSQYAPANETPFDIWYETLNLDGAILVAVAYGVHATLFVSWAVALWERRSQRPKQTWGMLAYICTHFLLSTVAFALNIKFNEATFITNRDFPGGPNGYFIGNQSTWTRFVGYVLYMIIAWLQDALLLYRYWMFWNRNHYMLLIPGSLYVTSIVMGSLLLARLQSSGSNIWNGVSVSNFFTAFWSIEISSTIFLTSFIVGRLLYMRYRIRKVMGTRHQVPYLSLAAMLAESGMIFSVGGLIFLISYVYDSPIQNIFLNTVGQLQSIAPVLIILRVARGQGLTRQTVSEVTRDGAHVGNDMAVISLNGTSSYQGVEGAITSSAVSADLEIGSEKISKEQL